MPNPEWNPATDPNAKQLASKIIVNMNVNTADIDNRLLAGDIDVDAGGSGVQAAAQARILVNPTLKAQADNPINGFGDFAYLNTKVAPLNNLHCREAIEYAVNKVDTQTAYGGPIAGGQIASTVDPPNIIGYKSFDDYNALTQRTGDMAAAKQQLQLCGQPNGFSTSLAYRSDRPKETAAATAIQASLALAGIKVTLKGFPSGPYYTDFAGVPSYVHSHDLGIAMGPDNYRGAPVRVIGPDFIALQVTDLEVSAAYIVEAAAWPGARGHPEPTRSGGLLPPLLSPCRS